MPRAATDQQKLASGLAAANLHGSLGSQSSADLSSRKNVERLQIALNKGTEQTTWDATPGIWRFEDGNIVGSLKSGQNGPAILVSQNRYQDFDLRFKAVVADDSVGTALAFRSHLVDFHGGKVDGPECLISGKNAPTDRRAGGLIGLAGTNELPADAKMRRIRSKENVYRIRCQGKHLLVEINGAKMVNAEFPGLAGDGLLAWIINGNQPATQIVLKEIELKGLSTPWRNASDRPVLSDRELLKAELEYNAAMNRANNMLMKCFNSEIKSLQAGNSSKRELAAVVEHEKAEFKEKGLIPWSAPMRHWLKDYTEQIREARNVAAKAFDKAIERAQASHNQKLENDLLEEAAAVLAPHEVARWKCDNDGVVRVFYSDNTFVQEGEEANNERSQFWTLPVDDIFQVEIETPAHDFVKYPCQLSREGNSFVNLDKDENEQNWQRIDD